MTDRINFECNSGDGTTGHARLRERFAPEAPVALLLDRGDGATRSIHLKKPDALALQAALTDWLKVPAVPARPETIGDLFKGLGNFNPANFRPYISTPERRAEALRQHAADMRKASDAIWAFEWISTPGGSDVWSWITDRLETFAQQAEEEAERLEREAAKPKATPLKDWLADKPKGTFFRYRTHDFSETYVGVKTGPNAFRYFFGGNLRDEIALDQGRHVREFVSEVTDLSEIAALYR